LYTTFELVGDFGRDVGIANLMKRAKVNFLIQEIQHYYTYL